MVVTVSLFATDQPYSFPPTGRFLFQGAKPKAIFNQCSRGAPSPNSEIWDLSHKDIDELEALLVKNLDERERAGKQNPPKGTKYHRQYVGFVRNGERFVYGNFYPADVYSGIKIRIDESKQAVMVCDGGPVFWGIVYRIKTKTFEEPQFNGEA